MMSKKRSARVWLEVALALACGTAVRTVCAQVIVDVPPPVPNDGVPGVIVPNSGSDDPPRPSTPIPLGLRFPTDPRFLWEFQGKLPSGDWFFIPTQVSERLLSISVGSSADVAIDFYHPNGGVERMNQFGPRLWEYTLRSVGRAGLLFRVRFVESSEIDTSDVVGLQYDEALESAREDEVGVLWAPQDGSPETLQDGSEGGLADESLQDSARNEDDRYNVTVWTVW